MGINQNPLKLTKTYQKIREKRTKIGLATWLKKLDSAWKGYAARAYGLVDRDGSAYIKTWLEMKVGWDARLARR